MRTQTGLESICYTYVQNLRSRECLLHTIKEAHLERGRLSRRSCGGAGLADGSLGDEGKSTDGRCGRGGGKGTSGGRCCVLLHFVLAAVGESRGTTKMSHLELGLWWRGGAIALRGIE